MWMLNPDGAVQMGGQIPTKVAFLFTQHIQYCLIPQKLFGDMTTAFSTQCWTSFLGCAICLVWKASYHTHNHPDVDFLLSTYISFSLWVEKTVSCSVQMNCYRQYNVFRGVYLPSYDQPVRFLIEDVIIGLNDINRIKHQQENCLFNFG